MTEKDLPLPANIDSQDEKIDPWDDLSEFFDGQESLEELMEKRSLGRTAIGDNLVYLNFLDNFREPNELTENSVRVTPEEQDRILDLQKLKPLQGELNTDDVEFKSKIKEIALEFFGNKPILAYNPGSGRHVSVAEALPEGSRTIFVDDDGDIEHQFIERKANGGKGYEFYRADMEKFELPDQLLADLVVIYNAGYLNETALDKVTKPGGLVVVNNYHKAADYMLEKCPGYNVQKVFNIDNDNETLNLHVFQREAGE